MIDLTCETLFVLRDLLKRLLRELPKSFSQDPALQDTCTESKRMNSEEIHATWRERIVRNTLIAREVVEGIAEVLTRVQVDQSVLQELLRLKDMANSVAMRSSQYRPNRPPGISMPTSPTPSIVLHSASSPDIGKDLDTASNPFTFLYVEEGKERHKLTFEHLCTRLFRGMQRTITEFSSRRGKHYHMSILITDRTDLVQRQAIENRRNQYKTHKAAL